MVLVPYGEGKTLITELNGTHTLTEKINLSKKAQQYSVNLYDNMFKRLIKECAIYTIGDTGVMALEEEYYDSESGIIAEPREMEFMMI